MADILLIAASPLVGSFAAAAAHRLPEDPAGLLAGRSRCEACGARIGVRDLVPVASWLVLRGRCRACRAPIGAADLVIEIGACAVAVVSVALVPIGQAAAACLLGWWLLALAGIDRRTELLPDVLTLPLIAAGFAATALLAPADLRVDLLRDSVIGAAAGYLAFAGIALLYRRLRGRDGLGFGDAKLLAAGGAWLGWAALPMVVLLAAAGALAAALASGRAEAGRRIAFGPWLAAAIWALWVATAAGIAG